MAKGGHGKCSSHPSKPARSPSARDPSAIFNRILRIRFGALTPATAPRQIYELRPRSHAERCTTSSAARSQQVRPGPARDRSLAPAQKVGPSRLPRFREPRRRSPPRSAGLRDYLDIGKDRDIDIDIDIDIEIDIDIDIDR